MSSVNDRQTAESREAIAATASAATCPTAQCAVTLTVHRAALQLSDTKFSSFRAYCVICFHHLSMFLVMLSYMLAN